MSAIAIEQHIYLTKWYIFAITAQEFLQLVEEYIGIIVAEQFLRLAVIYILVVLVEQCHHLIVRELFGKFLICRDSHKFLQAQQCWAGWRYCDLYLYVHIVSQVRERNYDVLTLLQLLQWIIQVHLVPYVLVGLNLKTVSLPSLPVEVNC